MGDPAALIWLVNQGVIEMHPWLATTRHPDHPTWMLLDLDPGRGVAFDRILHVAKVIGKALEALGLGGMPKTTGKRGVHLFVAIERRHTFDEVRAWLKVFLTRLAASHPNVLTLDKRLAERGGKVLVDYSQNAAGKSIAAPYGVRALPGASVSTPLTWREVAAGRVRPVDFTVRTVPDRLRRHGDLFAPLLRRPHRLRPLG